MPNLETHAVEAWLTEWHPGTDSEWSPAIRPLERAGDMPSRLVALGSALDASAEADRDELSKALLESGTIEQLERALAQLGKARCLRILHWIAERDLGDSSAIIQGLLQGQNDNSRALCGLLTALRRRSVLERIFAPDRLAALENACLDTFQEDAS